MMTNQPNKNELVLATVKAINGHLTVQERQDGMLTIWLSLVDKNDLVSAARGLKAIGARLSMITALSDTCKGGNLIAYHIDIDGSTVTLKVWVTSGGAVDSLMEVFRNADWHEREFMEFYDIKVNGRADAARLFLDESLEGAMLERLIPLSVLANAASTKMLWERLSVDKETQR
jgi:NADH-quinone oxidoreductase subunit C